MYFNFTFSMIYRTIVEHKPVVFLEIIYIISKTSQFKYKSLAIGFNRILHSHFSFYRGSHIEANKNVKHSKTATGHMQTFHTYTISKSPSSESEHSIFVGWYQIYKNYTTGDLPLMGPLWRYLSSRVSFISAYMWQCIYGCNFIQN